MSEQFDDTLKNMITNIISSDNDSLFKLSESELRDNKWFFEFDPDKSIEWNIYEFQDMINLYRQICRRWEEFHNGRTSVVERVRDKYLIPKIKEFSDDLRTKILNDSKV